MECFHRSTKPGGTFLLAMAAETNECRSSSKRSSPARQRYVRVVGLFLPIFLFHNFFQLVDVSSVYYYRPSDEGDGTAKEDPIGKQRQFSRRQRDSRAGSNGTPSAALIDTADTDDDPAMTVTATTAQQQHYYYTDNNKSAVLIAQYSACVDVDADDDDSVYATLLRATAPVNQAYARHWGHDYLLLQGAPFTPPHYNSTSYSLRRLVENGVPVDQELGGGGSCDDDSSSTRRRMGHQGGDSSPPQPSSRSTYNKIALLSIALEHPQIKDRYTRLLILDADAMMYDFDRDIGQWETNRSFVLAAHKIKANDPSGTGSINIGVTLWNLDHPLTPYIVERWKQQCIIRMRHDRTDDDQAPLQTLLKKALDDEKRHRIVYAVTGEFEYGRGTFVRHVIRRNSSWDSSASRIEGRLATIQASIDTICQRKSRTADGFPFCRATTIARS